MSHSYVRATTYIDRYTDIVPHATDLKPNAGEGRGFQSHVRSQLQILAALLRDHSYITFAKFSEKLTFLTP